MGSIQSFEDLKVWQKARILSKDIHHLTKTNDYTGDLSLKRQIKNSSGSIMDNIAEGFERGGNKEFIQFLYIAKGSCAELRSQLYRSLDTEIISELDCNNFIVRSIEISSMLQSFIKYLKNCDIKGDKYLLEEPFIEYGLNNQP
jgi:four helix bundle protein